MMSGLGLPGCNVLPESLQHLIDQFKRLPGIGGKSAQRLAFHILRTPREDTERLCEAIRQVKDRVTYCTVCSNITDIDPAGSADSRATGAASAWWKNRRP
jgi:recombination protein RecR